MKNAGIQLNNDFDLEIQVRKSGGKIVAGLVVGDVTYQNQAMILTAQKGEFKEAPTVGVGISDICADSDFVAWKREIASQIEADGQRIEKLIVNEKQFVLEARYI
jgi:hypothetical protein